VWGTTGSRGAAPDLAEDTGHAADRDSLYWCLGNGVEPPTIVAEVTNPPPSSIAPRKLRGSRSRPLQRVAKRALLAALARLRHGVLRIEDDEGVREFGAPCADFPEPIRLDVDDPAFWPAVVLGGSVGGGHSYVRGDWRASDLVGLLRMLLQNESVLHGFDAGLGRLGESLRRVAHRFRRNDLSGSRRNIRAHYDLGNDFFALFLDPTLTYSAAIFEREPSTLEEAQVAKYERICRKLALGPGDRLLEIGSGWGGFALHAARTRGCRVTTTTLSPAQREVAVERVAAAGLADRVTVLLEDYRELRGRFDKLVSIEMIEAVGHEYFDAFFQACAARLESHGLMALQAILISEGLYESARRGVDFIKAYIFPGGCLPSLGEIGKSLARACELRVVHLEDLTAHYARTLRTWRGRFLENRTAISRLGYSAEFQRMWEFYLCYCEAGFAEGRTASAQLVLAMPGARGAPILGALPA
jgi:cyclopropane-fatty-acyl-phospholipid synthase